MKRPEIVITSQDYHNLINLDDVPELLTEELFRASIIPSSELSNDYVSMNSTITYSDLDSGKVRAAKLVYPKEASLDGSGVSVRSHLGSALIGMKINSEITYKAPNGSMKRIKVLEVSPEQIEVQA